MREHLEEIRSYKIHCNECARAMALVIFGERNATKEQREKEKPTCPFCARHEARYIAYEILERAARSQHDEQD